MCVVPPKMFSSATVVFMPPTRCKILVYRTCTGLQVGNPKCEDKSSSPDMLRLPREPQIQCYFHEPLLSASPLLRPLQNLKLYTPREDGFAGKYWSKKAE